MLNLIARRSTNKLKLVLSTKYHNSIKSLTQNPNFDNKIYWDNRYKEDKAPIEWYSADYSYFKHLWTKLVPKPAQILHVGCGNSLVPEQMHTRGYKNVLNIDYSSVVIEQMKLKYKLTHPELKFEVMDAMELKEIPDNSVDVVFDKGMLDSILAGTTVMNDNTLEDIANKTMKYTNAVYRVLKPNGFLFLITFCHESDVYPKFNISLKNKKIYEGTNWTAIKLTENNKVPFVFKINKR